MQKQVLFILWCTLFLLSCTTPYAPQKEIAEEKETLYPQDTQYPSVSTTINPSNPSLGQQFIFTITAEDDSGIKSISWKSSKPLTQKPPHPIQQGSFDCAQQKICSHAWALMSMEEGLHEFTITVEDVAGKKMENVKAEATVGLKKKASSTTTTSSSTTPLPTRPTTPSPEPDDTPAPFFTCGNGVCEGGESFESCSQDCTQQDIVGTNPGNGACEPGEDVNNAPKDCTVINKQCGNNVCDAGEDRLNCYYDCWSEGESTGEACSSDSDCGYKQECKSGTCYSVECTSDYHCKGCARCSDNQCVPCGYGVQGYCTC